MYKFGRDWICSGLTEWAKVCSPLLPHFATTLVTECLVSALRPFLLRMRTFTKLRYHLARNGKRSGPSCSNRYALRYATNFGRGY